MRFALLVAKTAAFASNSLFCLWEVNVGLVNPDEDLVDFLVVDARDLVTECVLVVYNDGE